MSSRFNQHTTDSVYGVKVTRDEEEFEDVSTIGLSMNYCNQMIVWFCSQLVSAERV